MVLRVVGVTVAITLFFFSFSEPSFSITKEAATAQWNTVKGTKEESIFLINFILKVNMPGFFPDTLKERFYEIATPEDAKHLLDKLVSSRFRQKTTALTLLEGLRGDDFTKLFEEYLYLVAEERVQNRLYHIILYQDSLSAFQAAVKFLNFLQETGKEKESFFYISGLSFFKDPDILQEIIAGVSSESSITRAASYTALRNYPDDEVLAIIEHALSTDTAIIPGEKSSPHYSKRHAKRGSKQHSLIIHILNIAKKEISRKKRKKVEDSGYNEAIEGSIALSSLPDQTLGEMYESVD